MRRSAGATAQFSGSLKHSACLHSRLGMFALPSSQLATGMKHNTTAFPVNGIQAYLINCDLSDHL